ncbi:unnamed protein product [Rotaria sp. Silwood1]|nr:unnamed protein product [Rotaria sp. Silwood1]
MFLICLASILGLCAIAAAIVVPISLASSSQTQSPTTISATTASTTAATTSTTTSTTSTGSTTTSTTSSSTTSSSTTSSSTTSTASTSTTSTTLSTTTSTTSSTTTTSTISSSTTSTTTTSTTLSTTTSITSTTLTTTTSTTSSTTTTSTTSSTTTTSTISSSTTSATTTSTTLSTRTSITSTTSTTSTTLTTTTSPTSSTTTTSTISSSTTTTTTSTLSVAVSSSATFCGCSGFNLSLTNISFSATNVSYQWQSSSTGQNIWSNITALRTTSSLSVTNQTNSTDYRCQIYIRAPTIMNLISTVVTVTNAYCAPRAVNCSVGDVIDDFLMRGESNTQLYNLSSGCAANSYDDETQQSVSLLTSKSYTAWVSSLYSPGDDLSIWIDFNNNCIFETSEIVVNQVSIGTSYTAVTLTIPAIGTGATTGVHRMRATLAYGSPNSCSASNTYGETHDYTANILTCKL